MSQLPSPNPYLIVSYILSITSWRLGSVLDSVAQMEFYLFILEVLLVNVTTVTRNMLKHSNTYYVLYRLKSNLAHKYLNLLTVHLVGALLFKVVKYSYYTGKLF